MSIAARKFTERLPVDLCSYEMGIDPDGDISFDWGVSPKWSANVSIAPNGRIAYAAMAGDSSDHYSGDFNDGAFMEKLFNDIRRIIDHDA